MKNNLIKNYFYLFFSQIITLVLNIIMSIILPKVLSMEDFGYWQLFLFYSSFVGFFHFGINDGIYLRYGGKGIENINKKLIKIQLGLLSLLQLFLSILLIIYQITYGNKNQDQIVFFVVIFMIINNLTSFITSLFQAVNKLKYFSNITIITSLSFIIFISFFFITHHVLVYNITLMYVFSYFIGLAYALYRIRDILFVNIKFVNFKTVFKEYKRNTLVGFFLMISTVSSMLILGVGRFLIEKKWGIITFGVIALSFTITTFMLFFIRQIGIVIFPLLKRTTSLNQKKYFIIIIDLLNALLLGSLLLVPLINYIISHWLPKYIESLKYFIFIIPMIIYEGKMQIVLNTYMKVLRKETQLMYINIISMAVSFILCVLGFYINSLIFIILSMTFATILRSVILEKYLNNRMQIHNNISFALVLIITFIFIILYNYLDMNKAWLIYLFIYLLYIVVNIRKLIEVKNVINKAI